jgi:hypothetical protein
LALPLCSNRNVPFTVFGRLKLSRLVDHDQPIAGNPAFMNIQEHLSAFDRWLTTRIDEAQSGRKDLAFRDLALDLPSDRAPWEYSLLEPGSRSPQGEGWSVYLLHGVWPEAKAERRESRSSDAPGRRSLLATIADTMFGKDAHR